MALASQSQTVRRQLERQWSTTWKLRWQHIYHATTQPSYQLHLCTLTFQVVVSQKHVRLRVTAPLPKEVGSEQPDSGVDTCWSTKSSVIETSYATRPSAVLPSFLNSRRVRSDILDFLRSSPSIDGTLMGVMDRSMTCQVDL